MYLIYPRKESKDPFLENLSKAFESSGASAHSFLPRALVPNSANRIILNWPENLWSDAPTKRAIRIYRFFGRLILLLLLKSHSALGAKIVMVVHNAFPHGDSRGWEFWKMASNLVASVDCFVHFTEASRTLFEKRVGARGQSIVEPFPVDCPTNNSSCGYKQHTSSLIFLGVNEERKQLQFLLEPNSRPSGFSIQASGFENEEEFRDRYGFDPTVPASPVKWLGRRLSSAELEEVFHSSSILVLNQQDQLNSGLMWMAISRGVRVLAPETPAFLELVAKLGEGWLELFPPGTSPSNIQNLANKFFTQPRKPPPRLGSFAALVSSIRDIVPD